MLRRKLLLLSLFTTLIFAALRADVTVHGTVTHTNGTGVPQVNILVTAFYADSTALFESVFTDGSGNYEVVLDGPDNVVGIVQVSMVDCWGTILTQEFTIQSGNENITADFEFCETFIFDSCGVYIIEEQVPGATTALIAWIQPNFTAEFLWSTGDTTQTIYPQTPGTYCVTVTFPWNCNPLPSDCYTYTIDSSDVCFAYITSYLNNDGTYNLEAIAGGVAPFEYSWNTGAITPIIENVGPGTYCVTVEDNNGCQYTACTFIDDNTFCEVWISSDPAGALVANAYGQPPFQYLWNTGETSDVIYPNQPGLYCVTVADAAGCTSTSCYDYLPFPDTFCYVWVGVIMPDSNTIGLQAFSSSSAQSISYLWSTGESGEIIYPEDLTQTYCVTMTDSDGCTATACYEPINFCYAWIDAQYVDTNTAVLSVYTDPIFGNGGSNTSSYVWSTGDTTPVITVTENGTYCVTATLSDDCVTEACVYIDFDSIQSVCAAWVVQYPDTAGQWYAEAYAWGYGTFEYLWSTGDTTPVIPIDYANQYVCVTATSNLGCVAEACIDTFFNPCKAYISVNYVSNDVAILEAYGWNNPGQGGTYIWSTGDTGQVLTVNVAGTYCVTVTGGGCVSEACVEVYFWTPDSCGVWISQQDGQAGILYTAEAWGTAPFTYLWSNGSTEQSQLIDFGIHDLCVTVTDATNCVASACNYPLDSCFIYLWYSNVNGPLINIESGAPLVWITWSTGDSTPWLEITTPGTYCVTATDILGCTSAACITIDSLNQGEPAGILTGIVFADSLVSLRGRVFAYAIDPNGGPFALVDSTQIGDGNIYRFDQLPAGVYVVKAEILPGTVGYGDFIPSYHLSSTNWEEASPIVVPNWLTVTNDIWMIKTRASNGTGVIGGVVTDPQHILAAENGDFRNEIGVPGITVLLKDAQGNPMDFTTSMSDGSFRFTHLAFGTYRISYDIPGISSPDVWVTLTQDDPEKLQVPLVVNQGSTEVEEPVALELELYPNPARETIQIKIPGEQTDFYIQVVDMQGRIVKAGSVTDQDGIMLIEVGEYAPGLYHINLKGSNHFYFGRFVKQE